uniref:CST complex subunit CTC1 n=1 Tax=Lepisosteus oculatus TaxID=7918 RepID=W5N7V5_LEPOC
PTLCAAHGATQPCFSQVVLCCCVLGPTVCTATLSQLCDTQVVLCVVLLCLRAHSVYCRSVPLNCVTVEQLGNGQSWPADSSGHPSSETPLPIMLLGEWGAGQPRCIMGRVRCHVVCVLFLQLQWVCSLCSSVFKQGRCTRNYPPCHSDSGVFQAEAK